MQIHDPLNDDTPAALEDFGHPKGTLAILGVYMLLFVLGWAALYFGAFLPRGTPDATPGHVEIHQAEDGR